LIWFVYIAPLSKWGREGYFTRSNEFYLHSLPLEEGEEGSALLPNDLNDEINNTFKNLKKVSVCAHCVSFLVLFCSEIILILPFKKSDKLFLDV
jgi:hypothetical protein